MKNVMIRIKYSIPNFLMPKFIKEHLNNILILG
uniref:Uncharacterized protein n=1 Tax=Siphoviridae sp. ctBCr48 TaxID=2827802 RepID=A0A8S5SH83_9CAUD|nr:MAG TPA: hypothetical protein [Siphoviridae sp. ctBCr48]